MSGSFILFKLGSTSLLSFRAPTIANSERDRKRAREKESERGRERERKRVREEESERERGFRSAYVKESHMC